MNRIINAASYRATRKSMLLGQGHTGEPPQGRLTVTVVLTRIFSAVSSIALSVVCSTGNVRVRMT